MASNYLNFTTEPFFTLTKTTALKPPSSNERAWTIAGGLSNPCRIYGITVTPQTSNSTKLQFWLSDWTTDEESFKFVSGVADRGYRFFSLTIPSGNLNVPIDVMSNENCSSIFQKQRDHMGVPYFHLPTGWKIGVRQSNNYSLVYTVHGEIYGD